MNPDEPIKPTRVEGWDVQSLSVRQTLDLENGEVVHVVEVHYGVEDVEHLDSPIRFFLGRERIRLLRDELDNLLEHPLSESEQP